jgi:hypothetical protein
MTSHEDGHLSARVRDVVRSAVGAGADMELVEVEVTGPGSRPLIRVIVDTADLTSQTGVDVDDIASVSRQLGDLLDEDLPSTRQLHARGDLARCRSAADRPPRFRPQHRTGCPSTGARATSRPPTNRSR